MFIAGRCFLIVISLGVAIALIAQFRFQVSLLTERDLGWAPVAINISLLWSENNSAFAPFNQVDVQL
jgi:hypothetical protein